MNNGCQMCGGVGAIPKPDQTPNWEFCPECIAAGRVLEFELDGATQEWRLVLPKGEQADGR